MNSHQYAVTGDELVMRIFLVGQDSHQSHMSHQYVYPSYACVRTRDSLPVKPVTLVRLLIHGHFFITT